MKKNKTLDNMTQTLTGLALSSFLLNSIGDTMFGTQDKTKEVVRAVVETFIDDHDVLKDDNKRLEEKLREANRELTKLKIEEAVKNEGTKKK